MSAYSVKLPDCWNENDLALFDRVGRYIMLQNGGKLMPGKDETFGNWLNRLDAVLKKGSE